MEEPLMEVAKGFAALLGEYREVTGRIVRRADHQRYVLAVDRDRLAALNSEVDKLSEILRQNRL